MPGYPARVGNRRAMVRYAAFWNALLMVGAVVEDARKLGSQLPDEGVAKRWQVASAEDIARASRRADRALGALSKAARRWEAELVSREWRV